MENENCHDFVRKRNEKKKSHTQSDTIRKKKEEEKNGAANAMRVDFFVFGRARFRVPIRLEPYCVRCVRVECESCEMRQYNFLRVYTITRSFVFLAPNVALHFSFFPFLASRFTFRRTTKLNEM